MIQNLWLFLGKYFSLKKLLLYHQTNRFRQVPMTSTCYSYHRHKVAITISTYYATALFLIDHVDITAK